MKPPILELVKALEWYEEKIKLLDARHGAIDNKEILTLFLDGGKRARDAIKNAEPLK